MYRRLVSPSPDAWLREQLTGLFTTDVYKALQRIPDWPQRAEKWLHSAARAWLHRECKDTPLYVVLDEAHVLLRLLPDCLKPIVRFTSEPDTGKRYSAYHFATRLIMNVGLKPIICGTHLSLADGNIYAMNGWGYSMFCKPEYQPQIIARFPCLSSGEVEALLRRFLIVDDRSEAVIREIAQQMQGTHSRRPGYCILLMDRV